MRSEFPFIPHAVMSSESAGERVRDVCKDSLRWMCHFQLNAERVRAADRFDYPSFSSAWRSSSQANNLWRKERPLLHPHNRLNRLHLLETLPAS